MRFTYSLLLTFFILGSLPQVSAQNLLSSRRSSAETFVYRLSEKQALKLYKKANRNLSEDYFKDLIFTYPSDSTFTYDTLSYGHYMKINVSGNNLNMEVFSVNNLDLRVLDNSKDLILQFYDEQGMKVENVKIKTTGKGIRYDRKIAAFRSKKSNKKGIVKTYYQGHTNIFDIDRKINSSIPAKVGRFIVYSPPVRIVRSTIRYIYNSINNRYLAKPSFFYKIEGLFSGDRKQYGGYIVSQKPKYKPGDTVMVKAFILDHKNRSVSDELELVLSKSYNENFKFGKLKPYSPGAYHGEFVLHDSLKLKLDNSYSINFKNAKNKSLSTLYFRFEEYELKNYNYQVSNSNSTHWPGKSNTLKLKGTDSNGLFIPDAQYELYIFPKNVKEYHAERTFLPDTLWRKNGQLEPRQETEILVPDSIFGTHSMEYITKIVFHDASNESHEKSATATFLWPENRWNLNLDKDTLHITFENQNVASEGGGELWVYSKNSDEIIREKISSPYALKILPYYDLVKVENDKAEANMKLSGQSDGINVSAYRTQDSLFIDIQNIRDIPIQYFVYYGRDKEITRGHGNSLSIERKSKKKQNYHVSVQYVWGGNSKNLNYSIPFREKEMQLDWTVPEKVYPGQEIEVEIQASDVNGQPLENVDITAFGLTKKFNSYNPPGLSYYGKRYKDRKFHNSFQSETKDQKTNSHFLDWEKWNKAFGLDSLSYFKFIYPQGGVSQFIIPASKAQIAPFVYQKGRAISIRAIYINRELVYFSNKDQLLPYTFPLNSHSGNSLEIYTDRKKFTLLNIKANKDQKLLMSFDYDEFKSVQ